MSKLWILLFFTTTVTGFIGIGLLSGYYVAQTSAIDDDYAIVFDAGSSGTRMYIYKWKSGFSAARGDELVITEHYSCITNDNGIDKIKTSDELAQKFQNCMSNANNLIPDKRKQRTYISLAATAGMRLLELRDPVLSLNTLNMIRDYFSKTNYLYENSNQVKILSGQEEGTNAWISANYFLNKFKSKADPNDNYGILDLGGASTQIVYSPLIANTGYSSFFDRLKIYGVDYKPYSYSYLCRGSNQANLMYKMYLIKKNNFSKQLNAACYPINSIITLNASELIDSACTNGLMFGYDNSFSVNSSLLNKNDVYSFIGTSDSKTCYQQVQDILPKSPCSYSNCAFDNVYQPSIKNNTFYAISGYYYAYNNTESLYNEKLKLNFTIFSKATDFICSKSLDELKTLNINTSSSISNSILINMCFANIYAVNLLRSFSFYDLSNVNIVNKIQNYTVGWTLGYLINQLNRDDFLPYEEPPRKLPVQYFIPFLIILSFFSLISVFLLLFIGFQLRCYLKS